MLTRPGLQIGLNCRRQRPPEMQAARENPCRPLEAAQPRQPGQSPVHALDQTPIGSQHQSQPYNVAQRSHDYQNGRATLELVPAPSSTHYSCDGGGLGEHFGKHKTITPKQFSPRPTTYNLVRFGHVLSKLTKFGKSRPKSLHNQNIRPTLNNSSRTWPNLADFGPIGHCAPKSTRTRPE